MNTIRYGILSTSSIAPRFIAAVRAAKAGEIVALSSRTLEKAQAKAKEWGIPTAYGSHEALLEDGSVNVVYISTINALHYTWAKAALEKGKHVVCEKPCTTSEAETRELFALARQRGLFFMEAEKMLFLPAIADLQQRIAAGQLGEITMVDMSHSFSGNYNSWMYDQEAGGGPLLSSGIYAVQLLVALFGAIASVEGRCSTMENGVEWQYILTGTMKNGILFTARNSTRGVLENTARIYGTKGWAEIPNYWKARRLILHLQEEQILDFPCQHELIYEARHIKACVETGQLTSPVVTEEISAMGIRALQQVKRKWKAK